LLLNSISSCFRDIALLAYWGHEFDLSGLLDVIGHVTISYLIHRPFPMEVLLDGVSSPAVFEILRSKCIGSHEFDLSVSGDVIRHVTIW